MACGVFFHLKSGRFSAVGPFQSHNSAAEVKKQEVRQTAAEETAGPVFRITTPMRFNPMRA